MECPSCQTSIGDSDLCEQCGADLSLFKRVLNSRKHSPETTPVAVAEMRPDVVPPPSSNQPLLSESAKPRSYRAVSRAQHGSQKREVKQERRRYRSPTTPPARYEASHESFAPPHQPAPPPQIPSEANHTQSNDQLSEIDALFAALYDLSDESITAPKDEINLTDLIVRERSERLDLLFHLLEESLSPLGEKREFVELPKIPSEIQPPVSSELQRTLSQAIQEASAPSREFEGTAKTVRARLATDPSYPLENLRAGAPSASRLICALAMFTDLLISETLVAILLSLCDIPLPLHRPQLMTMADDLSCLILLIAFLLPGFCVYRAALLLVTGTTVGYSVYGITPVSLDGRSPTRFQLALRAFASPVLGLLSAPFNFFYRNGDRISHLIGTRLIMTTQEIVSAEKQTG